MAVIAQILGTHLTWNTHILTIKNHQKQPFSLTVVEETLEMSLPRFDDKHDYFGVISVSRELAGKWQAVIG